MRGSALRKLILGLCTAIYIYKHTQMIFLDIAAPFLPIGDRYWNLVPLLIL